MAGYLTARKSLRGFYSKLLNIVRIWQRSAQVTGEFYELMLANQQQSGFDKGLYIYMRYTNTKRVLVVTNFNRSGRDITVKIPGDLLQKLNLSGSTAFTDLLSGAKFNTDEIKNGVLVHLPASSGVTLDF